MDPISPIVEPRRVAILCGVLWRDRYSDKIPFLDVLSIITDIFWITTAEHKKNVGSIVC